MANIAPRIARASEIPAVALSLTDALSGAYNVEPVVIAETGQFGIFRLVDGVPYSAYVIPALPISTTDDANKVPTIKSDGTYQLSAAIAAAAVPNLASTKITTGPLAVGVGGTGVATIAALHAALGVRCGSVDLTGQTQVTVTLSSAVADTNYQVFFSPLSAITVQPYASNLGTTTFKANVSAATAGLVSYLVIPNI